MTGPVDGIVDTVEDVHRYYTGVKAYGHVQVVRLFLVGALRREKHDGLAALDAFAKGELAGALVDRVCLDVEIVVVEVVYVFAEAVELGSQLVQLGVGVVAGQPDGFSVTVVGVICSVKVLLLPLVYDGDAVEEDVERKYILCELKRGSMYQRGAGGNSLGGEREGGGGERGRSLPPCLRSCWRNGSRRGSL